MHVLFLFALCLTLFFLLSALLYLIIKALFIPFDLYAMTKGAFFAPSGEKQIQQILAFAEPLKNKRVADLGSGDGRVVKALAERGALVTGYEINPVLVFQSRRRLHGRAKIINQSYWDVLLRQYDIIVLYGIKHIMGRLEKKLQAELKPGTLVISNGFTFPTWKPKKTGQNVFLYQVESPIAH